MSGLGRVAVVANPVAKSGAGATAALQVKDGLVRVLGEDAVTLFLTQHPGHAVDIVRTLPDDVRTLVMVGGDGVLHEGVNGLMAREEGLRPRLGLVPVGSGNDYAATLGMSERVDEALSQILTVNAARADVGLVNSNYFAETLSFGIDAAIALDTVERRKRSKKSGTALYFESGIEVLFHQLHPLGYDARLGDVHDDELRLGRRGASPASVPALPEPEGHPGEDAPASDMLPLAGESFIFAVQIGPTYGGHFKVCPEARADDGLFDICLAHPPLTPAKALGVFIMAKGGQHVHFKRFEFHRAGAIEVSFDREPPAQMDGEKLTGTHFQISSVPRAIEVLRGKVTGAWS